MIFYIIQNVDVSETYCYSCDLFLVALQCNQNIGFGIGLMLMQIF